MKFLLALLFSVAAFAQTTFSITIPGENAVNITISAEAIPAMIAYIKTVTVATPVPVTLGAALTTTATTVTLSSTAGLLVGQGLYLEGSEIAQITAVSDSTHVTVVRARIGSSPVSGSSGDPVVILRSGSSGDFIANLLTDVVHVSMVVTPGPIVAAAQAAIVTQNGTIASTVAAGVTHTP